MTTRKNAGQIKEMIMNELNESPLSIEKLRKNIDSNWSTINNHLEELKKEGKIKEVFLRENLRLFARVDYPVFYGLPLDKSTIEKCLCLLSSIVTEWKKQKKENINKTTMQKIAVEVASKNPSLKIPVVRFHYGKVLPVFIEPLQSPAIKAKSSIRKSFMELMNKSVKKEINEGNHKNIAWQEKRKQYETHSDMKIFEISDNVSYCITNKKEKDHEALLEEFYKFFLEIPSSEKYSYLFEKYDEFLNAVNFIINSKEFSDSNDEDKNNYLKEILDTFNSLWQALTTEFFFEDIEKIMDKDYEDIKEEIKNKRVNAYSFEIEEKVNNLLDYKNVLRPAKRRLDDEEKKMLNILLEGANEE